MTREEAASRIKNDMRLHHDYLSGEYRNALGMAISALEQPEIIRCRECEYHRTDNEGFRYCCRKEYGYGWGDNDFCSDAERREEGEADGKEET